MTHTIAVECQMQERLPATLPLAEQFFIEFRSHSREVLSVSECFGAELLLREALTNAVVHGCHMNSAKNIRCFVRIKNRRLLILVEDEGPGFDWRSARDSLANEFDCTGRGMEILRKYANHVRHNDKGNAVAILKRFDERNTK